MPTLYRDGIASDKLVGLYQAFAKTMARLERPDTPILSYFSPNLQNLNTENGMVPHGQRTYTYKERQYLHGRTTLNGDVAAAATTFILTDKVCRPGDIIISGDEAILLVNSDDYLTFTDCERSVFTGADAAHADGDSVFVFGTSYAESSNAPTASAIPQASEVTTYTDIFIESTKVSGSSRFMEQYAEGNMDKLIEYTAELMIQLKKQAQTRLLFSDALQPVGEDSAGRFDGIYERVAAVNVVDFSASNITFPDIQLMARKITRKGGRPAALFVSDYQGNQIDTWVDASAKRDPSQLAKAIFGSHVYGLLVGVNLLDVIATDEMDTNCLMASAGHIRFGPKGPDRVFHPELLGKKGDYEEIQVVGEYVGEPAMPSAHCWGKDVKLAA